MHCLEMSIRENNMMKYPKMRGMMGPRIPNPMMGAKNLQSPMPGPMNTPVAPVAMPDPMKTAPTPTLPSIPTNMDSQSSIDLDDPQRLAKISTLMKMGRR